jgi:hypothetical protein
MVPVLGRTYIGGSGGGKQQAGKPSIALAQLAEVAPEVLGTCATGCSSQENRLSWRDRHPSGDRFHMWPTTCKLGVLGILSLTSAVVGYIACRSRLSYDRHVSSHLLLRENAMCANRTGTRGPRSSLMSRSAGPSHDSHGMWRNWKHRLVLLLQRRATTVRLADNIDLVALGHLWTTFVLCVYDIRQWLFFSMCASHVTSAFGLVAI